MYSYSEEALTSNEGKEDVASGEVENNAREQEKDENRHLPRPRRERSYYQYTLHGIIAHVGAINSGHYYSFIRNLSNAPGELPLSLTQSIIVELRSLKKNLHFVNCR